MTQTIPVYHKVSYVLLKFLYLYFFLILNELTVGHHPLMTMKSIFVSLALQLRFSPQRDFISENFKLRVNWRSCYDPFCLVSVRLERFPSPPVSSSSVHENPSSRQISLMDLEQAELFVPCRFLHKWYSKWFLHRMEENIKRRTCFTMSMDWHALSLNLIWRKEEF